MASNMPEDMSNKLLADELRKSEPTEEEIKNIKRNPIYLVVSNVLDTFNIGSLFRLADAAAVKKVYLCGKTEVPPSARIHKAAIGTENWVPWEYKKSTLAAIKSLQKKGVHSIAVEQDRRSISYKELQPYFPAAIIVGHETSGLEQKVLDAADLIVELPMYGINKSFNVWGSASIVAYKILEYI